MANTFTWRPTGGNYYSSSGSSAGGSNHFYYSSNRAFRMDFPNLSGQLGKDKKTLSITSAILKVYISTANSATLTIGYSYKTAYDDRKTMLAKVTGVKMKTSTGWMSIDLTDVIKAYAKDGSTSTMRLWGYGTGGSTTNSNFRGYNPSSSYTSQRPYLLLTYSDSSVWYNNNGTWVQCAAYYNKNGSWIQVMPYYNNGGTWIQV